jgi:hypothetical protein
MDNLPIWVYIVLALTSGLFGQQFLGQVWKQREKQKQDQAEHAQAQENSLLRAVIDMVQVQSATLTELLKGSLAANQTMANNIGQLALSLEGQNRDENNRFLLIREELGKVQQQLEDMEHMLIDSQDLTSAVVKALGANLETVMQEVQRDKVKEDNIK